MRAHLEQENSRLRGMMALQKQQSADVIIRRWRMGTLAPIFKQWRQWATEQRAHKKAVLEKTIVRLDSVNLWRAWRTWKLWVEHDKVDSIQRRFDALNGELRDQKRKRAEAMIKRWSTRSVAPCFSHWREWSRERRKHKRELLEKTLSRLDNSLLWRCERCCGLVT